MTDALVLGLSATGLAVVRALGRAGLQVAGFDDRRWEIGHRSRYLLTSGPMDLTAMKRVAGGDRPALLVAGDPELQWALENAAALDRFVALPSSIRTGQAADVLNKRRYYRHCLDAGVALSETLIPDGPVDLTDASDWLIKPARGGVAGGRVSPLSEAESPDWSGSVLQRRIPGADDRIWVYATHVAADGTLGSGEMVGQKLTQWPVGLGSASRMICAENAVILEASRHLIRTLGLTGTLAVEWKLAPDGVPLHIETNARPALWFGLCEPVVLDAYAETRGCPPVVRPPTPLGKTWAYAVREAAVGRFQSADVDALMAKDDPMPGLLGPAYSAALWLAHRLGRR